MWWAQVTLIPDEIRITVFNNGTWNGLNTLIPKGGQVEPISTLGDKLAWKKAQKNLTKKKTSEIIKRAIPHRNPSSTMEVCMPCIAPSRLISRHHWVITIKRSVIPNKKRNISFLWNHATIPVVKYRPPIAPNNGHGDSSTMW